MDDLISRKAALNPNFCVNAPRGTKWIITATLNAYREYVEKLPTAEPQIIQCKDCIHKPKPTEDYKQGERDNGFELEFPDYMCPLQCEDAYYSRLPKDDWFCGNAERWQDG